MTWTCPSRRRAHKALLAGFACLALSSPAMAQGRPAASTGETSHEDAASITPFRAHVSDEAIAELRRRIGETRWPEDETVPDTSQGLRQADLRQVMREWGGHDWRAAEARLNAHPQFTTEIDGLRIHFIHVRSHHEGALPLIMTHGWPGSVFELLGAIGPLTDPTAYGGRAEDAFDVVIPSIPGFGFSQKPATSGWNVERMGRAWAVLMKRLGYDRYVAQGGDWGAAIAGAMARQEAEGLLGIHLNLPATVPPEIAAAVAGGAPAPAGLSGDERQAFDALRIFFQKNRAYAAIMATKPQVIGTALTDSPAGWAAFVLDYNEQEPLRMVPRESLLDDLSLYWLTGTTASSARIYWEEGGRSITGAEAQKTSEIALPVAITVFPGEVYRAPETWARRAYRNLVYFHPVDRGGHFAAWEEPALFAEEVRAAFRPMRQEARR